MYAPVASSHVISTDPITLTLGANNPVNAVYQYSLDGVTFSFLNASTITLDGAQGIIMWTRFVCHGRAGFIVCLLFDLLSCLSRV